MLTSALAFAAAASAVAGLTLVAAPRRASPRRASLPALAARLAALLPARMRPPLELDARIEAAARPGGVGAGDVLALKLVAAFASLPFASAAGSIAPGRLGLALMVAGPAAAFMTPDLYLTRRARERIRAARRDLPGLLDLLGVAVDAGLSPRRALAEVGERSATGLGREWAAVARQLDVGVPLSEALTSLERRLPAPEIRAFTAALERAAVHGAPLSDTLAAQARDARAARRRRIEEEAAKASPKIQLVVALLLVPSVLLIVAAALVSALLGGDVGAAIVD